MIFSVSLPGDASHFSTPHTKITHAIDWQRWWRYYKFFRSHEKQKPAIKEASQTPFHFLKDYKLSALTSSSCLKTADFEILTYKSFQKEVYFYQSST